MLRNICLAVEVLRESTYTHIYSIYYLAMIEQQRSIGFVMGEINLSLLELRYTSNFSLVVTLLTNCFGWSSLKWSIYSLLACNAL
jgi:hypothetical protein